MVYPRGPAARTFVHVAESPDARHRPPAAVVAVCAGSMRASAAAPTSLATVIFSSGSTGVPKGVMLRIATSWRTSTRRQVFPIDGRRLLDRRAAVLPLVRLHRHAVVPAGRRLRRRLPSPIRWTRRPSASSRRSTAATMLISTPTFCTAYIRKCTPRAVRAPALCDRRRREAARADRARVQGEVRRHDCSRATAAPRCRRSSRSTARRRRPGEHQVGSQARLGRSSDARRRRRKVVDPDTGEGPLVDRTGCCSSRART